MSEIRALPWNGFTVASTFSGAGGSCTGYRMAGFRVVWANEFVPAAQESYKANAADDCYLDRRDIKLVQPADIFKATGLKSGELDLFDGSPPCQAFSTAGKREKGWGKEKSYEHGAKQCNEQLFSEYIRLLRGLMPKTFVAENVSGLVKGTAKGYFLEILRDLKASGYRVVCKVLDAQWLGVPQQRQRTIFVGVREDLKLDPVHPKPLAYRYSVRDALPWILKAESGPTGFGAGSQRASDPAPAVSASMQSPYGAHQVEAFVGKVVHDESGDWSEGDITDRQSPTVRSGRAGSLHVEAPPVPLPPSRMAGSYGVSEVDPNKLCPTVTIASPGNDLAVPMVQSGAFPEKYSSSSSSPSPAIMAGRTTEMKSATERRKFTIDELKRICAFPDDFILKGSYAQQWERLGNSVPPVMMKAIAETIRDEVLSKIPKQGKTKRRSRQASTR